MAKKVILQDPFLSEYVFDCISNATVDRKKRLSEPMLRKIKTAKAAKRFSIQSTIDEKLELLARLGYYYSFVIAKEAGKRKQIKDALNDFKNDNTVSALDNLMKQEHFATNNKQVMFLLNMMAAVCHSENYLLNRDFHKLGNVINNWKDITHPTVENIQATKDNVKVLIKYSLNLALGTHYLKSQTQNADIDFNILMYLYQYRNTYTPGETIRKYFTILYKKTIVSAALKRLTEKAFLEKPPIGEANRFQITSAGENEVFDWINKRISETLNY